MAPMAVMTTTTAAAAMPAAAIMAAVINLHGVTAHLTLHPRNGGRYRRGLSSCEAQNCSGSNCNRKYQIFHDYSFAPFLGDVQYTNRT
jgi:hypothetical protein